MSEREIRKAIEQACHRLEVETRAVAKKRGRTLVYPLMVGAGLFVANCDDESESDPEDVVYTVYGVPSGSPTATQAGTGSGTGTGTATGGGGTGGEAGSSGDGGDVGGASTTGGAGGVGGA